MEINTTKHRVDHSGVQKHYQAKMEANEKSFELVMAGLYSDPIKAFIRELSTNAYEAHQLIGIESRPFEVSLPTYNDLNFIIRDYGPGLSEKECEEIYMTIFKSTKESTNEFGGCFGLGSKSPYAYTRNAPFSVTSYHGGKKYSYVSYRNEEGIPCLDLLDVSDTQESGLEVKVPIKSADINTIHQKAAEVYSWFKVKPKLKNASSYSTNYNTYDNSISQKGKDYTIHNTNINLVRMGNIVYPIDFSILKCNKLFTGIILDAPIGSVVPMPSREGLRYNGHTVSYLSDRITEINESVIQQFQDDVNKQPDYYTAVNFVYNNLSAFPGLRCNALNYNGKPINDHIIYLNHGVIKSTNYSSGKISFASKYSNTTFRYQWDYGFFVNDSSAVQIRISDYCKTNNIKNIVICEKDKVKECAEEIGIPESRFIRSSTLPYVPPLKGTKKSTSNGHKTQVMKWRNGNYSCTYAWEDSVIDITTEKGYYVEYYANKVKFKTRLGIEIMREPADLVKVLASLNLPANTIIYGIKSELLRKFENKIQNLENILTKAEDWCYNNEKVFKDSLVAKRTYEAISHNGIRKIKKIFDNNSSILKPNTSVMQLLDTYNNMCKSKEQYGSYEYLYSLIYNKNINIVFDQKMCPPDITIEQKIDNFTKKYPLLDTIYDWMDSTGVELAYYILGKGY